MVEQTSDIPKAVRVADPPSLPLAISRPEVLDQNIISVRERGVWALAKVLQGFVFACPVLQVHRAWVQGYAAFHVSARRRTRVLLPCWSIEQRRCSRTQA